MMMDIQTFIAEAKQHHVLVVTTAIVSVVTTVIFMLLMQAVKKDKKSSKMNYKIQQESKKIVDNVKCSEIENMPQCKDGKIVMCRCWKSSTFPYCDGSHNQHNEKTGDNVGPLIINKN